jgi:cation transporter-like permease
VAYEDPTPVSSVRWTMAILVATVLGLGAWDVYVAFFAEGGGDTISEVTLYWARRHPVIPLVVGIVMGHLFWSQRVKEDPDGP